MYAVYGIAERLKMTVNELQTGHRIPLSNQEFVRWMAYLKIKQEREAKAQREASRSRRRG